MCKVDTAHKRSARCCRKTRAVAIGARAFRKELRHAAQPFFVLRFRERIFHGIHRVVICEIKFGEVIALLRLIQDVPFLGGGVEYDVALFGRELAKRYVCAYAHGATDLLHKVPHERAPYHHGAFIAGFAFIGHKRRAIHRARDARAAACGAGAFAVKGKPFGARAKEFLSAMRAGNGQLSCNVQAWWHMLAAVGAYMAAHARE